MRKGGRLRGSYFPIRSSRWRGVTGVDDDSLGALRFRANPDRRQSDFSPRGLAESRSWHQAVDGKEQHQQCAADPNDVSTPGHLSILLRYPRLHLMMAPRLTPASLQGSPSGIRTPCDVWSC